MNLQHPARIPLLFVGQYSELAAWPKLLTKTTGAAYELRYISETELADSGKLSDDFFLVFIDAAEVEEIEEVLVHLRSLLPQAFLLVMTASPTWKQARRAFQAGATDYMHTISNPQELQALISHYQRMRMFSD